jgi:nucleoside-diphosphate-sugar epimerase/choline dehydrogenase-like flavoprotein
MMRGSELRTQILVIGSGAGGATSAALLAERGFEVLVLEEGPAIDTSHVASNSTDAVRKLYRHGGLAPILGDQNIAFVEGRCVGGSTEINSGFWHRVPSHCYSRWTSEALVDGFTPEIMMPYFEQIEADLSVSHTPADAEPASSRIFRMGAEELGWSYEEVPRCQNDPERSPFGPGAKQSMQRTYVPRALRAGARLMADSKAVRIVHHQGRVEGVDALMRRDGGLQRLFIRADAVFVCGGPIQTPALLRRSGIRRHVGDSLCIHPMIKAVAIFDEDVEAHDAALPIYQVDEFQPTITLGGSVTTPGFLAMLLADDWRTHREALDQWSRAAIFYAAVRGTSRGRVRVLPRRDDAVLVRYRITRTDERNLSIGLGRLGELLFAAGARAVYPALRSPRVLRSPKQCRSFLSHPLAASDMALSTVHAFSSCPMGESPDFCATDSFGRVGGFSNLHVNDASLLPDSPGVNPQGTVMAIAARNADHYADGRHRFSRRRGLAASAADRPPGILVTGAPGWLGSRLLEILGDEREREELGVPPTDSPGKVRCLVHRDVDSLAAHEIFDTADLVSGDVLDPKSLREFCRNAEGATLFHIAGVIHPTRGVRELREVNVEGTRRLLMAAAEGGVRRVVAVSSNSPIGCNPEPDHLFDEDSPYAPYMAYGRSKAEMERVVREIGATGRIEVVIVRPPWFYGPHQPPRQTRFFQMIKRGRFPILGDGEQRRSMAYVDNICQGLLLAAATEQADGETYWIADERAYSINEIVDTVEEVLEEFGVRCAHERLRLPALLGGFAERVDSVLQALGVYNQEIHVLGEMSKTIACSVEKAKSELGFAPRYSLREGMRASIRWCLESGQRL